METELQLLFALELAGRTDDGAKRGAELLARYRRVRGNQHTATLFMLGYQAARFEDVGQLAKAEALLREWVDRRRRMFGADSFQAGQRWANSPKT